MPPSQPCPAVHAATNAWTMFRMQDLEQNRYIAAAPTPTYKILQSIMTAPQAVVTTLAVCDTPGEAKLVLAELAAHANNMPQDLRPVVETKQNGYMLEFRTEHGSEAKMTFCVKQRVYGEGS